MSPSVRTKLNECRARRMHVGDMPPAVAYLWWTDYAKAQLVNLGFAYRHTDSYKLAQHEWEEADKHRRAYVEPRWLDFLARHPTFITPERATQQGHARNHGLAGPATASDARTANTKPAPNSSAQEDQSRILAQGGFDIQAARERQPEAVATIGELV